MEQTLSIRELVISIIKRWKMILILTIMGTVAVTLLSIYAIKPLYQSKVKLFIGKDGATANYNNSEVLMYQNLLKTYGEIIKTDQLVKNSMYGHVTSKTSKEVLNNLSVITRQDTQIIEILYKSTNKQETEQIVNWVTEGFIKEVKNLIPNSNVKVIEKARVPRGPISPNVRMNVMIAFLLSIMGGVGLSLFLEFMDNTIKSTKDIQEIVGVSVLGTISIDERNPNEEKKKRKQEKKKTRQEDKNKKINKDKNESIKLNEEKIEVQEQKGAKISRSKRNQQNKKIKFFGKEKKSYDTYAGEGQ